MERILLSILVSLIFMLPVQSIAKMCFDFSKNNKIGLEDSIFALQVLSEIRENNEAVELFNLIRVLQVVSGDDVNVNPVNTDRDGKIDCKDNCPYDSNKTIDIDTDGDGIIDCNDPCPDDPDKSKYCLVWSDEFNNDTLDQDNWRFETGGTGWGNTELQYYTDRPENIQVDDGCMVITARQEDYKGKQWTSSRITTAGLHSFKYGKIEARMKLPNGPGIWPAFWMLGDSFFKDGWPRCGEIDIMETGLKDDIANGVDDRTTHATVHWASPEGDHWDYGQSLTINQPFDEDFHIFGIEWDDKKIVGYLDSTIYFTFDILSPEASVEEFHDRFYLILNLAVGGNFTGILEENKEQIDTDFPHSMYVDWVRVYQRAGMDHIQGDATFNFPPSGGDFVIFKDLYPNPDKIGQIALDVNAKLEIWNNLTQCPDQIPLEGGNSICFTGGAGDLTGFGILAAYPRNLCAYGDGFLRFALKTTSPAPFKIGIKSGEETGEGESWLYFNGSGIDPYKFMRDGQWHEIDVPLSDFQRTDISQIDQFFMLATDTLQSEFSIEIDDIYFIDDDLSRNTCPDPPDYNHYVVYNDTIGYFERFRFDVDGHLYIWNNLTVTEEISAAFEGYKGWKINAQPTDRFGFGISLDTSKNMVAYSDDHLNISLKSTSQHPFKLGISSGEYEGEGESWLYFNQENNPYGFARDGEWHHLAIPFADFQRTDFSHITQLFMMAGESPDSTFDIKVDNIYWENDDPDGTPLPDLDTYMNYVIYSETTGGKEYYRFDIDGQLQVWNYSDLKITENTSSYEGDKAWDFKSEYGKWFGAGISLNSPRDMQTFNNGYLRFVLRTSTNVVFRIGIKNGDSEGWLTFAPGNDLYGFTRDGNWHGIAIPLQDFDIALNSVNQLFMISANEGNLPVSSFSIEVDDLYWAFGDNTVRLSGVGPKQLLNFKP